MAEIIRWRGSPHEQTQELLPWYINGTLDAGETAVVDAHLTECADCRADLAAEQVMARELVNLSLATGEGWAAMRGRLDAAEARVAELGAAEARTEPAPGAEMALPLLRTGPDRRAGRAATLWQRRVAVGWLAGASALAASFAAIVVAGLPVNAPVQTYRALGAAPPAMPANVVVMFQPTIRESDIRAMLLTAHAQLVGGPTASGGYLLHVAPASRAAILDRLRDTSQVTLAEPVDAAMLEPGNGAQTPARLSSAR